MRRWLIALLVLISASTILFANCLTSPEPQETRSYIVQADDLEKARNAVANAGGIVTHELGIIRAVGATLTSDQLDAVRRAEGIKRVYEDREVATSVVQPTLSATARSSCPISASEQLSYDSDDVYWTVTNNGKTALSLAGMSIIWPKKNGDLREVEFNNDNAWFGKVKGVSATFTAEQFRSELDDEDEEEEDLPPGVTFLPGDPVVVEAEFKQASQGDSGYEIRLFFDNGCSVDFPSAPVYDYQGDSDKGAKRTYVASLTGADALHWSGITGNGVGIAIIDTGMWATGQESKYLKGNAKGQSRIVGHYDAIVDRELKPNQHSDDNGHGTHVASVIASSRFKDSEFNGIAPDASLTIVKAFDSDGRGTYLDVIRGIDWVVQRKDQLNVRVINMSFSASPQSYYWDDPLAQAAMVAWQNGIVVVASAGNDGPEPMTIGVPGNVPYVVTVGSLTDSVTPLDWTDDTLATFSSAGPTYEAFIKPDVVSPGGHVRGMVGKESKYAEKHPHYRRRLRRA